MTDYQLLLVAHPDDEAIFFAGPLLQLRDLPWKVVCVTDGNGDGAGKLRNQQWQASMAAFGITDFSQWAFPDIYERRLDQSSLQQQIRSLGYPKQVFTHGILGEYGHPHHQDVAFAVHHVFAETIPVFSPAFNCPSDFRVSLSNAQYNKKISILFDIYGSEFNRFANQLPAQEVECFQRVSPTETFAIYQFLRKSAELCLSDLDRHRHLYHHIVEVFRTDISRPF